jgi:hypothetical protein
MIFDAFTHAIAGLIGVMDKGREGPNRIDTGAEKIKGMRLQPLPDEIPPGWGALPTNALIPRHAEKQW